LHRKPAGRYWELMAAKRSTTTYEPGDEPNRCCAKSKQAQRRCKRSVVPGRRVCRYHGGLGGRPPIHGRYSTVLGHFREAYQAARSDPSLMDLRETMALLDIVVQKNAERAAQSDTPDFRKEAVAKWEMARYAQDDVERDLLMDDLGEHLKVGATADEALKELATSAERLAKRQERSWDIKLSAANAINARDLVTVLARFADIVLEEAPRDVAGHIIRRIDGEVLGSGPQANRLAAGG